MKRKVLFIIGGVILIFFVFVVYKITTFSLFDIEMSKVITIDVPNKSYKVEIFYIPPNATSQDYIQVRKKEDKGIEYVIKNFERYDFVVKSELEQDSLLKLVLKDTSLNILNQDTFLINLNTR